MKDLYKCCQNVDAKSIVLYSGIKIVHVVVSDRKPRNSTWYFVAKDSIILNSKQCENKSAMLQAPALM